MTQALQQRDDPRIPRTGFSNLDLPAEQRFDAWADYLSGAWSAAPDRTAQDDQSASSQAWLLGKLILTDTAYGAQRLTRLGRELRREERPFVTLKLTYEGRLTGLFDDRPYRSDPGQIQIFDMMREKQLVATRIRQKALFVPYDALGYEPGHDRLPSSIDLTSPSGRLLQATIFSMFQQISEVRRSEATALSEGLIGMLRGLLMPEEQRSVSDLEHLDDARECAMRRFIADNLQQVHVDADVLMTKFNASRSTVYRAFKEDGGVTRYVTGQRLGRAFKDLAEAEARRGAVRTVAERWGFHDPAGFNRAFKSRYGVGPGEVIGSRRLADQSGMATARPGRHAIAASPSIVRWLRSN